MRNKDKIKAIMFPPPSSPMTQLHSLIPTSSPSLPWATQVDWEQGLWSVLNGSSLTLSPHIFPLLQHASFPWAAVPQDKPAPLWTPPCVAGESWPQHLQHHLLLFLFFLFLLLLSSHLSALRADTHIFFLTAGQPFALSYQNFPEVPPACWGAQLSPEGRLLSNLLEPAGTGGLASPHRWPCCQLLSTDTP